jgi:HD superfamily phosphodiesterase
MKNSNRYQGNNPIPGPKRFGNHKVAAAKVDAAPEVVAAEVDAPVATIAESMKITSIDAKVDASPDANVVIAATAAQGGAPAAKPTDARPLASAEAKVDALDNVTSGEQILADTSKPAASTRPAS